METERSCQGCIHLQYTLLLLILRLSVSRSSKQKDLQYTLLLLILGKGYKDFWNFKFTIHFATINTLTDKKGRTAKGVFTIHFATINTVESC